MAAGLLPRGRRALPCVVALLHASPADALPPAPSIHPAIRQLMAKHDPILLYASRLLPPAAAADAAALYAWCRRLDELVDDPAADWSARRARLDEWEARLAALCAGSPRDEFDGALLATLRRHPSLGVQPFTDMLDGMRADSVEARRVASHAELEEYAYQVAGTVGLMLLPLLGVHAADEMARAREPAVALGKAIQLVNILRDARADAALGRIYLPQDEMAALGVREEDVLACRGTAEYCSLVARKAARAEALLKEAEVGGRNLPGLGPLLVAVIVELYRDYLVVLARRGYDNLDMGGHDRVSISTARKVLATLRALLSVARPTKAPTES
ncbi:hypothetical protein AB1Y20_019132 [Prymnesium parvum]|uniref:15-cis-phytoene synthase n=1 Tax=Prymnesium parvum TaxID=97485 RepID=A0AB34JRI1_PRYPA